MSTKKLLSERGAQYGEFKINVKAIKDICNTLKTIREEFNGSKLLFLCDEDIENFFLVLKLVRMQTSSDKDSLDDLIGYATLIRDKRFKP